MDIKNMSYEEKLDLALNPYTPEDVLRALAQDENGGVRGSVAENPSTPLDILRALAKDPSDWVRYYVAKNPKASSKILVTLFEYEKSLMKPDKDIIKALYRHKNLPAFAKRVIETLFGEMLP